MKKKKEVLIFKNTESGSFIRSNREFSKKKKECKQSDLFFWFGCIKTDAKIN